MMLHLQETDRAEDNTAKAFNPKIQEHNEHCDVVFPTNLYRHILSHDCVYRFIWHIVFREQKKWGGRKEPDADKFNKKE